MQTCSDAFPLIMSYLDGELSEAQAAPLRKHLLGCQPCRAGAQDQKNLKRWFQAAEPVAVPRDFAARVARRAFQGDRGEFLHPESRVRPAPVGAHEERPLRFVLALTALAAAVVIFLSIAIRQMTLPVSSDMRADDRKDAVLPLSRTLEELDRLNAREALDQSNVDRDAGRPVRTNEKAPAEIRRP